MPDHLMEHVAIVVAQILCRGIGVNGCPRYRAQTHPNAAAATKLFKRLVQPLVPDSAGLVLDSRYVGSSRVGVLEGCGVLAETELPAQDSPKVSFASSTCAFWKVAKSEANAWISEKSCGSAASSSSAVSGS